LILASALIVTILSFDPDDGSVFNHVSELTILQPVFDVILKMAVLLASALTLNIAGLTDKTGAVPAWVIVSVRDVPLIPKTVIVAVRTLTLVLDSAVKVIVSLPEPDAELMVNHESEPTILHTALEVIVNVALLLASALILNDSEETVKLEAACVTVTVWEGTPVAVIVTVAVRSAVSELTVAVKVTAPLFDPEAGLTVSHVPELDTPHPVLAVMLNVAVLLAPALIVNVAGETDKLGIACVIEIVWVGTPAAVTVTSAVRATALVLAVTVKVIVPLFDPEAGLTVSHVPELDTLHPVLEVMLNVAVLLAPAFIVNVAGETDKLGIACVTVIVWIGTPAAVTFTVVVRATALVLAVAVKVTVPLFDPEAGLTVSHVPELDTLHPVLEVMLNVAVLLAPAFIVNVDGETDKFGIASVTWTC
jgi:hypothetical protein